MPGGPREHATMCQVAHLCFLFGRVPHCGRRAFEGDETHRRRAVLGMRCIRMKVPISVTSLTVKRPSPRQQIRADEVAAAVVVSREQAGSCAHRDHLGKTVSRQ